MTEASEKTIAASTSPSPAFAEQRDDQHRHEQDPQDGEEVGPVDGDHPVIIVRDAPRAATAISRYRDIVARMASDPPDTALFVRIPQAQARALDRLAFESRRPKQAVVSELLGRYIEGRRAPLTPRVRRSPSSGWHSFRATQSDVLTLEGVAELLEVEPELVAELAENGELPGRRIGVAVALRARRRARLAGAGPGARPADG